MTMFFASLISRFALHLTQYPVVKLFPSQRSVKTAYKRCRVIFLLQMANNKPPFVMQSFLKLTYEPPNLLNNTLFIMHFLIPENESLESMLPEAFDPLFYSFPRLDSVPIVPKELNEVKVVDRLTTTLVNGQPISPASKEDIAEALAQFKKITDLVPASRFQGVEELPTRLELLRSLILQLRPRVQTRDKAGLA